MVSWDAHNRPRWDLPKHVKHYIIKCYFLGAPKLNVLLFSIHHPWSVPITHTTTCDKPVPATRDMRVDRGEYGTCKCTLPCLDTIHVCCVKPIAFNTLHSTRPPSTIGQNWRLGPTAYIPPCRLCILVRYSCMEVDITMQDVKSKPSPMRWNVATCQPYTTPMWHTSPTYYARL